MKKRLFITSALMAVVLGASLTTSTYAWYVSAGGDGNATVKAEQTVGTLEKTYTAGSFTITAVLGTPSNKVSLTDDDGKTWYYTSTDGTGGLLEDTQAQNKHGKIECSLHIEYTGARSPQADWTTYGASTVYLDITVKSGNVKIGSTTDKAMKAGESKVILTFNTSALTWTGNEANTEKKEFYFGARGSEGKETPTDNFGVIQASPRFEN